MSWNVNFKNISPYPDVNDQQRGGETHNQVYVLQTMHISTSPSLLTVIENPSVGNVGQYNPSDLNKS